MNDNNLENNVNVEKQKSTNKQSKKKLVKNYKDLGLSARDILKLTEIAKNDLLIEEINSNIKKVSSNLKIDEFKILLEDINKKLLNKLDEIKNAKKSKNENKSAPENNN